MKKLRVALVHDYIKEFGGAESVLEELSDLYPDAPIYTSLYCPEFFGPHRQRLQKKWSHRIKQSFFQYIPFASKLISPLRLLSPLAFISFNFSRYDVIISSATGAYFPNSINKKNAKLICYCHTPPRYLYGLPTARNLRAYPVINTIANIANHYLRLLDFHFSKNVDLYLANSFTTSARIKKFYRRDSIIVNPPVLVPTKLKNIKRSDYFLTGGRLARAKRYDIAIKACNQLNIPLKIFGRDFADYKKELTSISGPTIEFLGEVSQEKKQELFSQAQAYIFSSDNEDFGIVSVESMGYGCPVVGYKSGGIAETVIDGKTGVLFNHLDPSSCASAITRLKNLKINASECHQQALNFTKPVFCQKIDKAVYSLF